MSVRVVPVPLPHLHAVAIVAMLRGGPRFEGEDETGLTHAMEHMVFRGCALHPEPAALMAAFEEVGEDPDAHTGDDEIAISVLASPEKVREAARLLASVLLRPAWRHLERERRIILEERLELVDEDGGPLDLDDISRRLVFAGHPLGRSLVGEEADILRYGRADLERHRRRLVVSENLVVALAGPIGRAHVRAVREAFAGVPPGAAPRDVPVPLPSRPRTAFVEASKSAPCSVRLTFVGPCEDDPRAPALHVLSGVLDGGPTSRLPVKLVDAGYVYDAGAGLVSFSDVSLLEIDFSVSSPRLVPALERALAVVSGLRRGVSPGEVERARERIRRRRAFERDDALATAERHARRALFGHSTDAALEEARLEAVTPRSVSALAREVLRAERFSFILLGSPGRSVRQAAVRALRRFNGA